MQEHTKTKGQKYLFYDAIDVKTDNFLDFSKKKRCKTRKQDFRTGTHKHINSTQRWEDQKIPYVRKNNRRSSA